MDINRLQWTIDINVVEYNGTFHWSEMKIMPQSTTFFTQKCHYFSNECMGLKTTTLSLL